MNEYYRVTLAHAVKDENGRGTDGKAGDQTGKEVLFQNWYISGGEKWDNVLRLRDETKRDLIADNAERAVRNDNIGYDMNQRYTLYDNIKNKGFDCGKADKLCECDCSTLATCCVNAIGIPIAKDTRTANMVERYKATKKFYVLKNDKWVKHDDNLKRGDILVRGGHHTAIAVNLLFWLKRSLKYTEGTTMKGDDVKALQARLNDLKIPYPLLEIDGSFGKKTESAVKDFQLKNRLEVDGHVGRKTAEALGFLYN